MQRTSALIAILLSTLSTNASMAAPQGCDISASFEQKDPRGARTVLTSPDALVFSTTMHVDADGGPHAYSAKDPDGTLCNPKDHPENKGKDPISLGCAMDTVCDGLNITLPDKRTLDYRTCPELLSVFRMIRDADWKPPTGYHIEPVGIEMRDGNLPCLDANETYIVSPSSTPSGEGGGRCEQKKYLDTLVPSIVVPKCWSNAYRAENPKTCASLPAPGVIPDVEVGDLVALNGRSSGNPGSRSSAISAPMESSVKPLSAC